MKRQEFANFRAALFFESFREFLQAPGPAALVIAALFRCGRAEIVSQHDLCRFSAFQQLYGNCGFGSLVHYVAACGVGVLDIPGEDYFFWRLNFFVDGTMEVDVAIPRAYVQREASADAEIELQIFDDVTGGIAAHPAVHLFLTRECCKDSFARRGDGAAHFYLAGGTWNCCGHLESSLKPATLSLR